ncbi:MAG: HlyC/CorC family transporter [Chloroflexia bacterium]|nr:HlyC/CorC family transporter [Chloroflexia bacterium]
MDLLKLLAVVVLVFANGFFVAAEFALVSVRRTRVQELVAQGNRTARIVQRAIRDPDRFIAATQLGITIASLLLGWIGEEALSHLFSPLDHWVGFGISVGLSFAIITLLHVVLGELAPKSIALQAPERTSLWVARPILWSFYLFSPFIWVLNGAGNLFLRLIGVHPAEGHERVHSVKELKMLVEASQREGMLEEDERRMLDSVFDFPQLTARQVMIPRPDVHTISQEASVHDLLELFRETGHSRFPVLGPKGIDDVVGVVSVKDLLQDMPLAEGVMESSLQDWVRPASFFPENKPVGDLLQELREVHVRMAILVDEYGGMAGVLTVEDIVEEIVGELQDELDREPLIFRLVGERTFVVSGQMHVEDANEELGLNLPEEEAYETVAGFILTHLRRLPGEGETFRFGNVRLRVLQMRGPRIEQVEITHLQQECPPTVDEPTK